MKKLLTFKTRINTDIHKKSKKNTRNVKNSLVKILQK